MNTFKEITDFLKYLGDAILIVNESSEILFANPACENLFGYADSGMKGMKIEHLMASSKQVNLNHRGMVKAFIQSRSANDD